MKLLDTLGKSKKAIGGIVAILIVFALVFFAGVQFASKHSGTEITSTKVAEQLKEISDLATLEYNYTKVGKFENSLQLNGWDIPLTNKSFLLIYQGQLKAGIDMSKLVVDVTDKTIHITLPEVSIISNVIDENSIEVYDESNNLFNPIHIEDYTAFAKQQKAVAEEEALENGFLSQAGTRAEDTIRKLLTMVPEVEENYTIEITFTQTTEE